ncbi:MAG: hypothetical protein ACRDRN_10245 [Sciscionella sp.]
MTARVDAVLPGIGAAQQVTIRQATATSATSTVMALAPRPHTH